MKLFIRKILGYFGYDIAKKTPTPLFKKEVFITVAGYKIKAPVINPLIITYKEINDFGNEIARIASSVYQKYPSSCFLDIGANIGDTVATIKSVTDAPIISIEGDDFTFYYLQENTKQFTNVTLFKNYLGEKEETITFTVAKKGWNSTLIPDKNGSQQITLTTLDNLLEKNFSTIPQFKFLKLDTEGYDTIILRGSYRLLALTKPVLYFEYNQDNMAAINEEGLSTLSQLQNFGYETILFFDDKGRYILSTTLNQHQVISELNNYADGKHGLIYYYNLCIFHKEDADMAKQIIDGEKKINLKK